MRTQVKIKKAAAVTATEIQYNQTESYRKDQRQSSLKDSIGEFLLYLQFPLEIKQLQKGWSLFEILLLQYIELKCSEDAK
jgi:hypothetical protein